MGLPMNLAKNIPAELLSEVKEWTVSSAVRVPDARMKLVALVHIRDTSMPVGPVDFLTRLDGCPAHRSVNAASLDYTALQRRPRCYEYEEVQPFAFFRLSLRF
jgi:hypothetical protein